MFTRHNGVGVYHTYKNDEIENGANTYWFVTDPYATIDDAFDVRDLPGYDAPVGSAHLRWYLQDFLASLIESGVITADGVKATA